MNSPRLRLGSLRDLFGPEILNKSDRPQSSPAASLPPSFQKLPLATNAKSPSEAFRIAAFQKKTLEPSVPPSPIQSPKYGALSLSDLKPTGFGHSMPLAKRKSEQEKERERDRKKEQQKKINTPILPQPLKDAISFHSNVEYEQYLFSRIEDHGLTTDIYDRLRMLFVSSGDLAGLHRLFRHLGDLNWDESHQWLEKADAFRQMGRLDLARELLEKNAARHPNDAHAAYALAMAYKLERDYELAIHWLKKWQRLDLENADVYYQLATTYRRTGAFELARESLLDCLRLNPQHLMAIALKDKLDNIKI